MMSPEQVEELANKVEEHFDNQELDFTPSVGCFEDEGIIYVSVDTWEVNEDPMGCADDIISLVSGKFPELDLNDTECHEMVMVTFKIDEDMLDEEDFDE